MVVEGIESEAQMDMLRVIGCTQFQGYHLARPTGEQAYLDRFTPTESPDRVLLLRQPEPRRG